MSQQDIARYPWVRRVSEAWTTPEIRAPVIALMQEMGAWGWIQSWGVAETFTDRGVDFRTKTLPLVAGDTVERPGQKILVLTLVRNDRQELQVALSFPRGAETPEAELTLLLARAKESILALHRKTR